MTRCASILVVLLSLTACGDDAVTPDAPGAAAWSLLAEDRVSSLLGVWAGSASDVWVVGGREAVGQSGVVFHYDGTAWTRLDPGQPNIDLWQVFGFPNGDVFIGGANGTILRYRDGTFEKLTTPTTDIVFGLWGTSPDDVWATGGQFSGRGFVWRYTGGAGFEAVPGVPTELDTGGAVWKVTGRAADDVHMSASRGFVLHWDGQALANQRIGTTAESLFSIGCGATTCVAAGTNTANGVLYELAGSTWTSRVPTQDGPVWRGVAAADGVAYTVGMIGAVVRRADAGWVSDPHGLTTRPLHAAWALPDGSLFAVGGNFDSQPTRNGVLLYKGPGTIPPLP